MKLRNFMTDDVRTCTIASTVLEVAGMMRDWDVGVIPVVDEKKLVGVVTDRDIVVNVVAEGQSISETSVERCMSRDLISGFPDMDVEEAAQLMAEHQIRRLPVVDKEGGQLLGIVSIGDLATTSDYDEEAGQALSEISEPGQVTKLN